MCGSPRLKICTSWLDNRPLIDGFVCLRVPPIFGLKALLPQYIEIPRWLCFVEIQSRFPVEEVAVVVSRVHACHFPDPACPRWSRGGPWTSRRQLPKMPKISPCVPPFH